MVRSARPYTFPRHCRLRRSPEFDRLYTSGRRITTRYFMLYGLPNDRAASRLGLTVSRKMGGAVERNRVKRVFRDLFRRYQSSLLKFPYDLVVNARRGIVTVPYKELEAAFCQAVTQLQTDGARKSSVH